MKEAEEEEEDCLERVIFEWSPGEEFSGQRE